ncbi:MAG: hypothetical protein HY361_01910 [Candidatus Aenigmarchaeota archaeon]|nr:hypothetical protein [Candidatus Aenigmarchaeota archaeon]
MRNLLKSRKAQFFILSAFVIVSLLLLVSRWLEPLSIIDTSSATLSEEPFIFNNVKEKAVETVITSNTCGELRFNLEEYKNFIQEFSIAKNIKLSLEYEVVDTIPEPCNNNVLKTKFNISLESPSVFIRSNFTSAK